MPNAHRTPTPRRNPNMTIPTAPRSPALGVMPLQLHDYQHVAVSHLHRNPRAALLLDMGLG